MLAPALVATGGIALFVSLFLGWSEPEAFFGALDTIDFHRTGWELWDWADVPMALLGVALLGVAVLAFGGTPIPRGVLVVLALPAALAIATTIGHGFEDRVLVGPYVAVVALAMALVGLVLLGLRPRERAARAG